MKNLKHHRAKLLLRHVDLSGVTVARMIQGRTKYLGTMPTCHIKNKVNPEHLALEFYLRNHIVTVLQRRYDPSEPLGVHAKFVEDYHTFLEHAVLRMYYYLSQICVRETRHNGYPVGVAQLHPKLHAWYMGYSNSNNPDVCLNALSNPPADATMGELSKFFCDAFYKGSYGSGYGGKAWGGIADVLKQFVHGEITGEMMLDTAFTLCHNNGPIFNKGMWFEMYVDAAIKEILDVQRAGMIPQYVYAAKKGLNHKGLKFVTPELIKLGEEAASLSPEFTGAVEWDRFEELGAINSYDHYVTAGGPTLTKWEKIKKDAEDKAKAALQEAIEKSKYFVSPTITVKKVERQSAA